MTLKKQIAELTEEVRRLREEVAALRLAPPPVQFVSVFTPHSLPHPLPFVPVWPIEPLPRFTITCETVS